MPLHAKKIGVAIFMPSTIDPGLWPIIVFVALTGYAAFVSCIIYSPIFRFLTASLLPLLAVYALHVRAPVQHRRALAAPRALRRAAARAGGAGGGGGRQRRVLLRAVARPRAHQDLDGGRD